MKKRRIDQRQVRYFATADFLEESNMLRLIICAVLLLCAMILSLIIWSAFASLEETAVSYGEVVTSSKVHIVQDLEGGIVKKIFVEEGQHVKKGQLLVTLDSTQSLAELAQMQSREVSLLLDEIRLRSYAMGKSPSTDDIRQHLSASSYQLSDNEYLKKMLKDEKFLLQLQHKLQQEKNSILKAQYDQRYNEVIELKERIEMQKIHITIVKEEFKIYDELSNENYVSKIEQLAVERRLNEARGNLKQFMTQLEQADKALVEAKVKLRENNIDMQQAALDNMGKIQSELLQVRHNIDKLRDRVRRQTILSPIDGIVKGLDVHSGSVVTPNGTILELVPKNVVLRARVKVTTRDIGHIRIGDKVKVKVITYDYSRYGFIWGTVKKISASTFTEGEDEPHYVANIDLAQDYVGEKNNKHKLIPGMTVQADIITGKKSILNYLLKPIHRSAGSAFTER